MCIGPYFPNCSSLPLSLLGEPTLREEHEAALQNRFVETKKEKMLLKESRLVCEPVAVRRLARALKGWTQRGTR